MRIITDRVINMKGVQAFTWVDSLSSLSILVFGSKRPLSFSPLLVSAAKRKRCKHVCISSHQITPLTWSRIHFSESPWMQTDLQEIYVYVTCLLLRSAFKLLIPYLSPTHNLSVWASQAATPRVNVNLLLMHSFGSCQLDGLPNRVLSYSSFYHYWLPFTS